MDSLLSQMLRDIKCPLCSRRIGWQGEIRLVKDGAVPLLLAKCSGPRAHPPCPYEFYVAVFPPETREPAHLAVQMAVPFFPKRCHKGHFLSWEQRDAIFVRGDRPEVDEVEVHASCGRGHEVRRRVRWVFHVSIPSALPEDIARLVNEKE